MSIEPIIFCLTTFVIMAVLVYKLKKIVKKFDDILRRRVMEKALEELKREYPLICNMSFEWGWKSCEEAMNHKTCHWCKQSWEPNNQTFHKYFCSYLRIPIHGNFYCNKYEPKDTQC